MLQRHNQIGMMQCTNDDDDHAIIHSVCLRAQAADSLSRHSSLVGRRSLGFTMIELLVSLSILVLLFGLLFVPMLTGMNLFHRGKKATEVQAAAQTAMAQMQQELAQAMYVYPNDNYLYDGVPTAVPSRIDFILPKNVLTGGTLLSPLQSERKIVTYYVRLERPAEPVDVEITPTGTILKATAGPSPNLHKLYRAEYLIPGSGAPHAWRTYSSTTAKLPYTHGGEHPAFSLEDNTRTSSADRRHNAVTVGEDIEVAALTFRLQRNTTTQLIEGVTINLNVGSFDVARGGGVFTQLRREVFFPNVQKVR